MFGLSAVRDAGGRLRVLLGSNGLRGATDANAAYPGDAGGNGRQPAGEVRDGAGIGAAEA